MLRPRIACLHIPKFQIGAHQKNELELRGKPFALLTGMTAAGSLSRATVFMCSDQASKKQVGFGMKLSEARAVCADLAWRQFEPALYADFENKLMRNLLSCSPKVSMKSPGVFLLDATGLKHLGGEEKLCGELLKSASRNGFVNGNVGIADSAFAAIVSSRFPRVRRRIIKPGKDTEFLGPLSIEHLPITKDVQQTFVSLGIKTMEQLLKLPAEEVAERFGPEGMQAYELAAGRDKTAPMLLPQERKFHCIAEAGVPIESLEHVIFVLKSMMDHLLDLLKEGGLNAEELTLSFYCSDEKFAERIVKLIRPSNQTKFLLELIRLSLDAEPIGREFTGIAIEISKFSHERWEQQIAPIDVQASPVKQLSINEVKELSEPLALLLQRFKSRLGENAVLRAVANDQYFPENSGLWIPVLQKNAACQILPVNATHLQSTGVVGSLGSGLVLKQVTPKLPVLVELGDKAPTAICYYGRWHKIKEITVPERLSGLWWADNFKRSYYVALTCDDELSGSSLVLIMHDHVEHAWFIEGFFD